MSSTESIQKRLVRKLSVKSINCLTVLRVKSKDKEKSCRMLLHTIQLVPQYQYKKYEFEKFVNISDQGDTAQAFPVLVSATSGRIRTVVNMNSRTRAGRGRNFVTRYLHRRTHPSSI